jgi:hypothetical protein
VQHGDGAAVGFDDELGGSASLSGHAFYDRLQDILIKGNFDAFAEGVCQPFYTAKKGVPSIQSGRYFRMHHDAVNSKHLQAYLDEFSGASGPLVRRPHRHN